MIQKLKRLKKPLAGASLKQKRILELISVIRVDIAKAQKIKRRNEILAPGNKYAKQKPTSLNAPFKQKKFCSDVATLRFKYGFTVREAAYLARVAPSVFSRTERGQAPSIDNFIKLCTWMGRLTIEYFI